MKLRTATTTICILVLCLILNTFHIQPVKAALSIPKVMVDGTYVIFDVDPKIVGEGYMLAPVRQIYEALGAELVWNPENRTVWAAKDDIVVVLTIGSSDAIVNGEIVKLDAPAEIVNGRTFVPVRFSAESLNADVKWNSKTRTAVISSTSHDLPIISEKLGTALDAETKEQIKFMWQLNAPSYSGNPYVTAPTVAAPYQTGELQPAFINDALKMTNFVRYLADLPSDLVTDPTLNMNAQHGSVLLSAHGELTHFPSQPSLMDELFFSTGAKSTASSNIAYYKLSSTGPVSQYATKIIPENEWSIAYSVRHYMSDEDDMNIAKVGHRRWILNPRLQKLGFGYSHTLTTDGSWNEFTRFSAMQIFDSSRSVEVDYDFIAWPNKGYFPIEFFGVNKKTQNSDPWSITLHPLKYQEPQFSDVTVQITRVSDQKEWTLDYNDQTLGTNTEFFTVSESIGVPATIIFRPNDLIGYHDGDVYKIKVEGLKTNLGLDTSLQYEVSFFSLE